MSAAAINPAPSPTNGAAPAAGANASGQAAQAQGPLAAFEAMLNTLFGAQGLGADGTAAKTGAKATPGTKTATDDAKTKTDGDGKSATADATAATAAPDASLALLIPTLPTLPIVAAPAATDGTAAQPGAAGVADKAPGQTAAAVLAALAAADGGKAKAAAPAALSVNGAATNATAIAKVDAALAPKTDGTAASVPQPAASQAQPATGIPAPPAPALVAAAVVTPPTTTPIEATAPVGSKDLEAKEKVTTPKAGVRVDASKAEAMPGAAADALAPKTTAALQSISDGASKGGSGGKDAQQPAPEATTAASETSAPPADPTTSSTTTAATLIHAATVAVRGAPQTVANLAAQIVKKLDGRSTQFDIQLDPAGLGKVDVRVAIGADGRMSAAMSFDTPQAAAELRSRAGELQRALEQSGFDLSGGMSFDVASDRGQGGQGGQAQNQQPDAGAAFRGRAFQAALGSTADTPPPQLTLRRTALAGVDIRI